MDRRQFVYNGFIALSGASLMGLSSQNQNILMTVNGPIRARSAGIILEHEHVLVDFIGAKNYDPSRWDRTRVAKEMLPYLKELKSLGCNTLIEFTPAFLGRDPLLLQTLSNQSGLNILTNTGYYGAGDNRYLPSAVLTASASKIADIWIREYEEGIEDTGIRPGFIKISVNPGPLSEMHKKLVQAAAITHLKTGLTIASHTGPAIAAFEQLNILKQNGAHPSSFIWVHAQNESDTNNYIMAADMGAWISLDGVQESNLNRYVTILKIMKDRNMLDSILISQDAGWFEPGNSWKGPQRDYTTIFTLLIPRLKTNGFRKKHIKQLFEINPRKAFALKIRGL